MDAFVEHRFFGEAADGLLQSNIDWLEYQMGLTLQTQQITDAYWGKRGRGFH